MEKKLCWKTKKCSGEHNSDEHSALPVAVYHEESPEFLSSPTRDLL